MSQSNHWRTAAHTSMLFKLNKQVDSNCAKKKCAEKCKMQRLWCKNHKDDVTENQTSVQKDSETVILCNDSISAISFFSILLHFYFFSLT